MTDKKEMNYHVQHFEKACSKCRFSYEREKWMGYVNIECHHPDVHDGIEEVTEDGVCDKFSE